ncbi:Pre-mRNA splicing factor PRP21 like protein-domain-containing protein [Vararia minispora EC-137]|uniref:Pre-mRNA splicing factor PRP21 like protein-domain-containing protein n=1 Tax=Vararia minispora EC-137 TaxID=1314806 RepID=A0ACB8QDM3_9AGAM|nr:Pre-mRNA splicing factor PRP21 like protein-domain-containing protein [Vararia minispora EC-137]
MNGTALATSTPPPTNGSVPNGSIASANHDGYSSLRFSGGLILPPPEVKSIIDRTATFVARSANPPLFEDKIRENQRSDPKFSFLNPADPYHAYYRHRVDKVTRGEVDEEATPSKDASVAPEDGKPAVVEDIGTEPPPAEFILSVHNVTAHDLDIMKLAALFAAQRGRPFLASLAAKEGRNYQFEFLKPTHSLFGYFNQLIEQYQKVLFPAPAMLERVKVRAQSGSKWAMLDEARSHATWERKKREREKKREDDQEAERVAFAEIDWHDYAIVQTIEFTAADANAELPLPMTVQEVESMTLAQKRMAAMIMETTAEDVEAHRTKQAAAEAEAAAAVGNAGASAESEEHVMEVSDDEGEAGERKRREEEERQRELERAKAIQASSLQAGGPMKIRTDYVPKVGQKNKVAMTTCKICGQQVPVNELQEHMRIELLDPKWKEQRDALERRKEQTSMLQAGADVVGSLNNLARTRVDIFGAEADEERRKREEEEERERRKAREKVVWDGHTATKAGTLDKYSTNVNFDEQIAAIHRAKGLGPQDVNAIGPGIGTASAPPPMAVPLPAALPNKPVGAANEPSYAAATVSSGPQPASMYPNQPAPVMLPPLHYQGLDAAQPFGYQPPPVGIRGPAPAFSPPGASAAGTPVGAGMVRNADEMEDGADDIPPAKRQRVAKLPHGQYYPEQDWISMHPHPISLRVQLPTDPSKPENKLDGTIVTILGLPVEWMVSTLREKLVHATGTALAPGKFRFAYNGQMLTNQNTLASYNLEDEDLLVASVQDRKKK